MLNREPLNGRFPVSPVFVLQSLFQEAHASWISITRQWCVRGPPTFMVATNELDEALAGFLIRYANRIHFLWFLWIATHFQRLLCGPASISCSLTSRCLHRLPLRCLQREAQLPRRVSLRKTILLPAPRRHERFVRSQLQRHDMSILGTVHWQFRQTWKNAHRGATSPAPDPARCFQSEL
jgi:hypothetical protein